MSHPTQQTIADLSTTRALRNDRFYVGRREDSTRLSGTVAGESRQNVWIHGARRIGKSSLARKLERDATEQGTLAVWCDMSDCEPTQFDDVLERAVTQAEKGLQISFSGSRGRERFDQLLESRVTQPLMIIFDEFDRVAPCLALEEQKFLRKRSEAQLLLSYVFVTRARPGELVEEVSVVVSRLLGVCPPHLVRPLSLSAIRELARRAFSELGISVESARLGEEIWQRVGGLSVACMRLIHALASYAVTENLTELLSEEFPSLLEREKAAMQTDLVYYWWDLHPRTRLAFLTSSELPSDSALVRSANDDGFVFRNQLMRPTWLLDLGTYLGANPPSPPLVGNEIEQRVERIHSLIFSVNEGLKLNGHHQAFEITNEALRWNRLRRVVDTEEKLGDAIDYLYKLFYESVGIGAGGGGVQRRLRLPSELGAIYRNSQVVADLSALRNHYRHDKNKADDTQKLNYGYRNIGEIFERYAGIKAPSTTAHFRGLLNRMVDDACSVLEKMDGWLRSPKST